MRGNVDPSDPAVEDGQHFQRLSGGKSRDLTW